VKKEKKTEEFLLNVTKPEIESLRLASIKQGVERQIKYSDHVSRMVVLSNFTQRSRLPKDASAALSKVRKSCIKLALLLSGEKMRIDPQLHVKVPIEKMLDSFEHGSVYRTINSGLTGLM
jgi:hypothetical protein